MQMKLVQQRGSVLWLLPLSVDASAAEAVSAVAVAIGIGQAEQVGASLVY